MEKIEITVRVILESDAETPETVIQAVKDAIVDALFVYRKSLKVEAIKSEL